MFLNQQSNPHWESETMCVMPGVICKKKKSTPFLGHRTLLHEGTLKKGSTIEGKGREALKVDGRFLLHKLNNLLAFLKIGY